MIKIVQLPCFFVLSLVFFYTTIYLRFDFFECKMMPDILEIEAQETWVKKDFKQNNRPQIVLFCKRLTDKNLRLVPKPNYDEPWKRVRSWCYGCNPDFQAMGLKGFIPNYQCPGFIPYPGIKATHVFDVEE